MNRRRLWNSHQRHKFLRAEAFGEILKFRVSEMEFLGFYSFFKCSIVFDWQNVWASSIKLDY